MNNELLPIDQLINMNNQILSQFKEHKSKTEKDIKELQRMLKKRIDQMPIDGNRLGKLNKKRIAVCMEWMGGKKSPAYQHSRKRANGTTEMFSRKVFYEAGSDFKEHFGIAGGSYRDITSEQFDEAMAYWDKWEPSTNTKLEIEQLNNQVNLLVDEG